MNVLTASGNLGKDAEVRSAGGTSVASFSVAMKSGYGDKQQTIWLDCSLALALLCLKGDSFLIFKNCMRGNQIHFFQ